MNKKIVSLGAIPLLSILGFLMVLPGSVQAQSFQTVGNSNALNTPYFQGLVKASEEQCSNRLSTASGPNERTRINNSNPYGHLMWTHPTSDPSNINRLVGVRANQNYQLKFNWVDFYCATVVQNSQNSGNKWPSDDAIIPDISYNGRLSTENPLTNPMNDRAPVASGLHEASLTRTDVVVNSITLVNNSRGTVTATVPGSLTAVRNSASRYAGSDSLEFTYNPGSISNDVAYNIEILFNLRSVHTFESGAQAVNNTPLIVTVSVEPSANLTYRIQGVKQVINNNGSLSNFPCNPSPWHTITKRTGNGPSVNQDESSSFSHAGYTGNTTVTAKDPVTCSNGKSYTLVGAHSDINDVVHPVSGETSGNKEVVISYDGQQIGTNEPGETPNPQNPGDNPFVDVRFYYREVSESTINVEVRRRDGGPAPSITVRSTPHTMGGCGSQFTTQVVSGSPEVTRRVCTGTSMGTPGGLTFAEVSVPSGFELDGWEASNRAGLTPSKFDCTRTGCSANFNDNVAVTATMWLRRIPSPGSGSVYTANIEAECSTTNRIRYRVSGNDGTPTSNVNYVVRVNGTQVSSSNNPGRIFGSGGSASFTGESGQFFNTNTYTATVTITGSEPGQATDTATFGPCAQPASTCPSIINSTIFLGNPFVTRTLSDRTPSSYNNPGSYSTSYSYDRRSGTQRWSQGRNTNVVVRDSSNPKGRPNVILPSTTNTTNTQITLDYNKFVDECPFDRNEASVDYDSVYNERNWNTNSNYSESCPWGYSFYSSSVDSWQRCRRTNTTSPQSYCPYPQYQSGSSCYTSITRRGSRTSTQSCSWSSSGPITCYYPSSRYEGGVSYRCPSGYSPSGNVSSGTTCYYYSYSQSTKTFSTYWSSSMSYNQTNNANGTVVFPTLEPCWNRSFSTTASLGGVTIAPDYEQPGTASVPAVINADFGVAEPAEGTDPMRLASSINGVSYVMEWGINNSNWQQVPGGNGTRTIAASGSNSDYKNSRGNFDLPSAQESVNVGSLSLRAGDRVCFRLRITSPANGFMDRLGNRAGSGSGTSEATRCSDPIVDWPYFKVFGNDVVSGGVFGACSNNSGGGIRARNRGNGTSFRGSSTQYAALALDTISGFGSVSLKTSGIPASPNGLTFANDGFLGNFRAGVTDGSLCLPDYFVQRPGDTVEITGSTYADQVKNLLQTENSDTSTVEYYYINRSEVTLQDIAVVKGSKKVFYIDGTLNLDKNITFDTTWGDRSEIPYAMFVARNVSVHPDVTQLDGVYIAQPNSSGANGDIETCRGALEYNRCNKQLVVNGSFAGKNIYLERTRGSLRDSVVREGTSSTGNCSNGIRSVDGTPGGFSCAAEIFNFSPEVYLSISDILAPEDTFKVDVYLNLPPIL